MDLQAKYYRLDYRFDTLEPRLDDMSCIPELQEDVRADNSASDTIATVASCMIASLFYFELDTLPETTNGRTSGTGRIKCTLRANSPALTILLCRLRLESAEFHLNDSLILGNSGLEDVVCSDGSFSKSVRFDVIGRFTISLRRGNAQSCPISGSPFTIRSLVSAQKLNAPFGTWDHRKRRREFNEDCLVEKRQRI